MRRFPDPELKKRLASQLDVDPRRIQVWFQNRRQREKPRTDVSVLRGRGAEVEANARAGWPPADAHPERGLAAPPRAEREPNIGVAAQARPRQPRGRPLE